MCQFIHQHLEDRIKGQNQEFWDDREQVFLDMDRGRLRYQIPIFIGYHKEKARII
jgi:hypothetical protein